MRGLYALGRGAVKAILAITHPLTQMALFADASLAASNDACGNVVG